MDANERREQILKILWKSSNPQSGSHLAELLKVSRQVIVQDIALLRAAGENIFATPQGYVLAMAVKKKPRRVMAAQHEPAGLQDELETIVSMGGQVIDVVIEHALYGELRGLLMLSNKQDITDFVAKYQKSGSGLLLTLTNGVHLHTVEADSEAVLEDIEEALRKKGFLVSQV